MASIGRLIVPIGGACPGAPWLKGFYPCPTNLLIASDTGLSAYLHVDFNSRGKVGSFCGGLDTYVSVISSDLIAVDVWGARLASVWSSSVQVEVYLGSSVVIAANLSAYPAANAAAAVTKSVTSDSTSCGTAVKATVTVNDDGTFSIA